MVFAWVDGNTVFTQSKFSGGKRVKGQKITVYDTKEKILLEGKTDDKGEFSFKVPERTTLKIVLYAGAGHRAEWTVTKEDIEEMSGEKPAKSILKKSQGKVPVKTIPSQLARAIRSPQKIEVDIPVTMATPKAGQIPTHDEPWQERE